MILSTESRHTRQRSSIRSMLVLGCVSFALVLQSLAPPGYMAGSLSDGWPVVLCPEGLPAGFLVGHHPHHHEVDAGTHDLSLDGHCPLGGVLDAVAPFHALALPGLSASTGFDLNLAYRPPLRHRPHRAHPTRAPPAHA